MALEVAEKSAGDGSQGENCKPSSSSESAAVPTKKKGIIHINPDKKRVTG